MTWIRRKNWLRVIVRGYCAVSDCPNSVEVEGELNPNLCNPPWFSRPRVLPEGWIYERGRYLIYSGKYEGSCPHSLFCPEHAPVWIRYTEECKAYSSLYRDIKKSWWLFIRSKFVAIRPKPISPFEL